ncbi:MAG: hypothetical protein KKH52_01570 [Nanoarchaeota archaeon]|nr:hypothetical protein [Nanoarchaeota archaeon]MBU1623300.1 hypothetical protein [Nanoarchaeota archaeon]MBU1974064.1 hypothetical protein [Nanoarchaeota archaeon]
MNLKQFTTSLKRNLKDLKERKDFPKALASKTSLNGKLHHLPAEIKNLPKNTYLFMSGPPGRAKNIAENCFDNFEEVTENYRAFHLYSGTISGIPVASMASQMGFGSLEIAVQELAASGNLGALIRVGSCGALAEHSNKDRIQAGDLLIGEYSSFAPLTALSLLKVPWHNSRPDPTILKAMKRSRGKTEDAHFEDHIRTHCGGIYSKGNLYRDELFFGSFSSNFYHTLVKSVKSATGHLGSEMEAAMLELIAEENTQKGVPLRVGTFCLFVGEIRHGQEVPYVNKEKLERGQKAVYSMVVNITKELYHLDQKI